MKKIFLSNFFVSATQIDTFNNQSTKSNNRLINKFLLTKNLLNKDEKKIYKSLIIHFIPVLNKIDYNWYETKEELLSDITIKDSHLEIFLDNI